MSCAHLVDLENPTHGRCGAAMVSLPSGGATICQACIRTIPMPPPMPHRTTTDYCPTCGMDAGIHWEGCPDESL